MVNQANQNITKLSSLISASLSKEITFKPSVRCKAHSNLSDQALITDSIIKNANSTPERLMNYQSVNEFSITTKYPAPNPRDESVVNKDVATVIESLDLLKVEKKYENIISSRNAASIKVLSKLVRRLRKSQLASTSLNVDL